MLPDENRQYWAERSGRYSPAYYAQLGPNEVSEILVDVFGHYVDETAGILEVGCGSGRHLARLADHGFVDLTGIDINDDAFTVLAETYPKLATTGTFYTGAIEDLVSEFGDGAFDVVYSVEVLQHIHPRAEWVFEELVRITSEFLVTAENEGNSPQRGRANTAVSSVNGEFPLFHRNWKQVFVDRGVAQLVCEPTSRDTIRVFRLR